MKPHALLFCLVALAVAGCADSDDSVGTPDPSLTAGDADPTGDATVPDAAPSDSAASDAVAADAGAADTGPEEVETSDEPVPFSLSSETFAAGAELPQEYACCNGNPPLSWEGAPEGTLSFVLIHDDPDASFFDHWAIFNIPATESGLAAGVSGKGIEGQLPEGSTQLSNGFGFPGYLGSCPPVGHTYRWRLWALDKTLAAEGITDFSVLEAEADGAALAETTLTHTYGPATPDDHATCD